MRMKRVQGTLTVSTVEAFDAPSGEQPKKPSVIPQTAPMGTAWHLPSKPASQGTTLLGLLAASKVEASQEAPCGLSFVREAIDEIRRLKRESPEVRSVVVFDLDNTIFDTRARTLAAMKAFDDKHGTRHFAELELEHMGKNGKHTAELAGVPELADAVHAFWLEFFWKGENFLLDHVMTNVAELAHEAHAAGAEVVYLTGRVDAASTLAQLAAAGLPHADPEHVVCKPAVGANTGKFKGVWLKDTLDAPNTNLAWFLTEGRRDIQTVQEFDARVPCVRLGFVHEREGHTNLPGTPIIPESFGERRHTIDVLP